jgi:hypothetical protein
VKGKKQYQKLHKKKYGEEAQIGFVEFLEIWGGCADLGYEGAWFGWANTQILIAAWRKCGWLGNLLAPEEIDRSSFIDQPTQATAATAATAEQRDTASPTRLTFENALAIPDGIRSGSLAAAQAQVEQLKQYIQQNTHAAFDPFAAGILSPKKKEAIKRVRDKSRIDESEGGDAFLRDLACNARDKQVAREEHAAGVEQRKKARLEKKEEATAAALALRAAFDLCTPTCQCGESPCPQAKLKLCATCGDIKPTICRKGPCMATRQPLLLTMREDPTLPAP